MASLRAQGGCCPLLLQDKMVNYSRWGWQAPSWSGGSPILPPIGVNKAGLELVLCRQRLGSTWALALACLSVVKCF